MHTIVSVVIYADIRPVIFLEASYFKKWITTYHDIFVCEVKILLLHKLDY